MSVLHVKKLSPLATIPKRASSGSAGYDLASAKDLIVPARGKALVPTDLAISLPDGVYGRVAPRSGLAWKHHIDVGAGVIDQDYRGNIGIVLFNHSCEDFNIAVGDRIAQLILEKIEIAEVEEVLADLSESKRGTSGFGSTGRKRKICTIHPTNTLEAVPEGSEGGETNTRVENNQSKNSNEFNESNELKLLSDARRDFIKGEGWICTDEDWKKISYFSSKCKKRESSLLFVETNSSARQTESLSTLLGMVIHENYQAPHPFLSGLVDQMDSEGIEAMNAPLLMVPCHWKHVKEENRKNFLAVLSRNKDFVLIEPHGLKITVKTNFCIVGEKEMLQEMQKLVTSLETVTFVQTE